MPVGLGPQLVPALLVRDEFAWGPEVMPCGTESAP